MCCRAFGDSQYGAIICKYYNLKSICGTDKKKSDSTIWEVKFLRGPQNLGCHVFGML